MWTPDVYEGAPTPVTAFFSVAPKIAALMLFVRVIVEPFGGLLGEWRQIIWAISVASMVLGAVAAINQQNIKRLMAYSSIGHARLRADRIGGGHRRRDTRHPGLHVDLPVHEHRHLRRDLVHAAPGQGGRAHRRSGGAVAHPSRPGAGARHLLFSMAGIPPLAGFFAKLYIFLAAIDAGLYALAVIGVLASVVGAFFITCVSSS